MAVVILASARLWSRSGDKDVKGHHPLLDQDPLKAFHTGKFERAYLQLLSNLDDPSASYRESSAVEFIFPFVQMIAELYSIELRRLRGIRRSKLRSGYEIYKTTNS